MTQTFQQWRDEGEETDETKIKGFSYVRSDVSLVTTEVQYEVFENLMELPLLEAKQQSEELIRERVGAIIDGEIDGLGIPFGLGQDLSEYGSSDRTPQPQYRGAKYANEFIYGADAIGEGDKGQVYFYVEEGHSSLPRKTYSAETAEDGRYVDAISVVDASDLPSHECVDKRKMIERTIVRPMKPIFTTLGWDLESHLPPRYFRDEDQMGFESFA